MAGSVSRVLAQADTLAIREQLAQIRDRDQKTRKGRDSVAYIHAIDSSNVQMIENLISRYGWLGKSFAGTGGNQTCFLVIQHADLATQLKYIPLLRQSVADGESNASDLALMEDRINMRSGKKQRYGSQVVLDNEGRNVFYPIEDEKNVNLRRAEMGLEPIEKYARHFGIIYIPVTSDGGE